MTAQNDTILRQWQMLRLIPRYPQKITASMLKSKLDAEQMVVSKRTVERDLHGLSLSFPIMLDDREKPFGWSWQKDASAFDLPGLGQHEALTLKLVQAQLKNLLPASTLDVMSPYFKSAEQRLKSNGDEHKISAWQNKVRAVTATQPLIPTEINESVQINITQALLLDQQVKVSYLSRTKVVSEYRIHPLSLVQRGGITYLFVHINDFRDARLLAMHRILDACILDEPAYRSEDFDIDIEIERGRLGYGRGETIKLEAKFTEIAGEHLFETPLSLDQNIALDEDGCLMVIATIPNTPQLLWWLLGFGAGVEVISPLSLRESIKETIIKAAKAYS